MNIQFAGDILAVGNNRVSGDTQHVRNLFVAQSANDLNEHVAFTVTQFLRFRLLVTSVGLRRYLRHGGTQDIILHRTVVRKILLRVP